MWHFCQQVLRGGATPSLWAGIIGASRITNRSGHDSLENGSSWRVDIRMQRQQDDAKTRADSLGAGFPGKVVTRVPSLRHGARI